MKDPVLADWIVIVYSPKGRRTRVKVQAQYYRVDCGDLVFRTYQTNTYPINVHRFARGHWQEVISA